MNDLTPSKFELAVYVRDPEKLVYEGIVKRVTAINSKGIFDILGIHENFITIIKDKIIIRTEHEEKEFPVVQGILKVEGNIVNVFLGTESL